MNIGLAELEGGYDSMPELEFNSDFDIAARENFGDDGATSESGRISDNFCEGAHLRRVF